MAASTAITGRSVRAVAARTTDLINVLTQKNVDAAAVAGVLRAHGETEPVEDEDVDRLREAAHRIRQVLAAQDTRVAAERINRILDRAHPPRLTDHKGTTHWHVHVDACDDAPWAPWFEASSALMLALVLTDRQRPPGGVCAAHGCERVFVDCGSGSARRYCSKRCATRARVAAHRRATTRKEKASQQMTATASTSTNWSS